MRSLDINKANLDNQRGAVQEERRLRVDNQPYGQTFEKTGEQAYDNPAYKHSVIGSMEDLSAASVDDVATFFDPLNIMCSNRWAKPVRPGRSSFDPTWYHSSA